VQLTIYTSVNRKRSIEMPIWRGDDVEPALGGTRTNDRAHMRAFVAELHEAHDFKDDKGPLDTSTGWS